MGNVARSINGYKVDQVVSEMEPRSRDLTGNEANFNRLVAIERDWHRVKHPFGSHALLNVNSYTFCRTTKEIRRKFIFGTKEDMAY